MEAEVKKYFIDGLTKNQKLKEECMKRDKFKMAKKSYNPFKMWGSYVGAMIFTLVLIALFLAGIGSGFGSGGGLGLINLLAIIIAPVILIFKSLGLNQPLYLIALFIVQFIYGFLIGYGIHALIRAFKN